MRADNITDISMAGIYTLTELQQEIDRHPEIWRPLIFTNGCFDLLHPGHIRYLQKRN
jgi:D-glycero-beta-D-manno-heptose 1-phosphate adenylyltransferase